MLILPWALFIHKILIKSLPADMEDSTAEGGISFQFAVFCLKGNELHSFVFAGFRRLAAKKALASSRKSFSFFKRRISFSCSLTCWRSRSSSSLSVMALCGVCEPAPRSRLPSRWTLTQPYMVF